LGKQARSLRNDLQVYIVSGGALNSTH